MQVLFDALLDSFVLCSFGVQTNKLRGDRLAMVGKTVELYRYLTTTALIINAHVNQTLQRMLQLVHTNAIACMAEHTVSKPRTLANVRDRVMDTLSFDSF